MWSDFFKPEIGRNQTARYFKKSKSKCFLMIKTPSVGGAGEDWVFFSIAEGGVGWQGDLEECLHGELWQHAHPATSLLMTQAEEIRMKTQLTPLHVVSLLGTTVGNTTVGYWNYSPAIQWSSGNSVHSQVSTDKEDVPVLVNEKQAIKEYNMNSYLFRKLHVCT